MASGFRLIPLVIVALVARLLFSTFRDLLRGSGSTAWPTAAGTILEAYIDVSPDSEGSTYRPSVVYTYSLGGVR